LECLKVACVTLKEAQRQHRENRDKGLAEALKEKEEKIRDADDPDSAQKAAKAVEALIRKHCTQESYDRIRYVFKGGFGGGLQQVDVLKQDPEGNVTTDGDGKEVREVLLEVDEIHKAILERNQKHFHQATDTPFGGGEKDTVLYDLIGYTGMSEEAKAIVEGTFLDQYGEDIKILPETEQLIKELAMPPEIKALLARK